MHAILRTSNGRTAAFHTYDGATVIARNDDEMIKLLCMKSSLSQTSCDFFCIVELPADFAFDTISVVYEWQLAA